MSNLHHRRPKNHHHQHDDSQTCLLATNGRDDDARGISWNTKYHELAEFYKKYGHFRAEGNTSLTNWIKTQRRKRKGAMGLAPLTDEQIQLLDEIDFPWNPKKGYPKGLTDKRWMANYKKLADFYKKHGHFRVKLHGRLFQWIVCQRRKRDGMTAYAPLTDEQIQLLDEIDFPWDPEMGRPKGPNDKQWMTKYRELAKFYNKHGHIRVKYQGTLYRWMMVQRRKRRGTKGLAPLTDEQIQFLDKIDFPWDPVVGRKGGLDEKGWNSRYQELAEFYETHGHLRVDYQGGLYRWMIFQRRKRKGWKGLAPLTDEQIQLLDEIDFPWDPEVGRPRGTSYKRWNTRYQELVEFYKKHGHLRVEYKGSLYQWIIRQRRTRWGKSQGGVQLSDVQIQLLDEINFPWDPENSTAEAWTIDG